MQHAPRLYWVLLLRESIPTKFPRCEMELYQLFTCILWHKHVTSLISGQENFLGTIVHPQNWTSEHDQILKGKRVALIGSGATAITIFPGIKVQICSLDTILNSSPSI